MPEFAQGLMLAVTDRNAFEQFVKDEAHDPGTHYDSWMNNSVPEMVYVVRFNPDDEHPYYQCLNEHVNGVVGTHYYDAQFLNDALDAGVLEDTGDYDVDFVQENK